jgi:MFS family permease
MYYGLFGATWAIAGALGPVIGGAFSGSSATWRWCFYLNRMYYPLPVYSFVLTFFS